MSNRDAPLGACILTASVATVVGGFFGLLGLIPHALGAPARPLDGPMPGILFGALAGLLVSRGWIAWMHRHAFEHEDDGVLGAGVRGGMLAGAAASVLLHLSLQVMYRSDEWLLAQGVGLVFGVVGGMVVGLVGGFAWRSSLARGRG